MGDRLWVRETFCIDDDVVFYRATDLNGERPDGRLRPSIHMPRWASRINLEITISGLGRLNTISEEDTKAEGIQFIYHDKWNGQDFYGVKEGDFGTYAPNAYGSFMYLWDSITQRNTRGQITLGYG